MMTIDADDITYQVKSSESAGRRLMKDRKSGLVFWATPETVTAAELQNEEPAPSTVDPQDIETICLDDFPVVAEPEAPAGRELLPEFLRAEPKRRAPRKRKVNGT